MSEELIEQRLRDERGRLPVPDAQATEAARAAVLAAASRQPPGSARRRARARRALAPAAALVAVALAFGAGYGVSSTGGRESAAKQIVWSSLGISVSLDVPAGWSGRVNWLDGFGGAVLLVANFELEGRPGGEDPIKAMGPGDVLVVVSTAAGDGEPAPARLELGLLQRLPQGSPRVPRGHALADGAFCFPEAPRCLQVEVDFGSATPASELIAGVDGVLRSLSVTTPAADAPRPETRTYEGDDLGEPGPPLLTEGSYEETAVFPLSGGETAVVFTGIAAADGAHCVGLRLRGTVGMSCAETLYPQGALHFHESTVEGRAFVSGIASRAVRRLVAVDDEGREVEIPLRNGSFVHEGKARVMALGADGRVLVPG